MINLCGEASSDPEHSWLTPSCCVYQLRLPFFCLKSTHFGVSLKGNQRETKGKPKGNQRETKGKPKGNQRETKGKPKGNQRETKGKPKGNQRETKGKPKVQVPILTHTQEFLLRFKTHFMGPRRGEVQSRSELVVIHSASAVVQLFNLLGSLVGPSLVNVAVSFFSRGTLDRQDKV